MGRLSVGRLGAGLARLASARTDRLGFPSASRTGSAAGTGVGRVAGVGKGWTMTSDDVAVAGGFVAGAGGDGGWRGCEVAVARLTRCRPEMREEWATDCEAA